MTGSARRGILAAAWVAAALGGCGKNFDQARQLERDGQLHLAYEEYRRAAIAHHDSRAVAGGLARTSGKAVEYWRRRAREAAGEGDWDQAAKFHLKVLQIRPDDLRSILALRKIERDHPEDVALAQEALDLGVLSDELMALAGTEVPPEVPDSADPNRPAPGPAPAKKPPAKPEQKTPPKAPPAKPPAKAVEPAKPKAPAKPGPKAPPKPKARPKPKVQPVAATDPHRQTPAVRWEPGAAKSEFLKTVRVSRDDDRYPKKRDLAGGLAVKVKDTDKSPLDADMEVYLGRKRIGRYKDLPEETVIEVLDESGRPLEIVIISIYDPDETVTVGLRKSPFAADRKGR